MIITKYTRIEAVRIKGFGPRPFVRLDLHDGQLIYINLEVSRIIALVAGGALKRYRESGDFEEFEEQDESRTSSHSCDSC